MRHMMAIEKQSSLVLRLKQFLSLYCSRLGDKIIDKTGNAMWSSGYPATHTLLSHIVRRPAWAKNTIVPLLCIAAALEIAEELF